MLVGNSSRRLRGLALLVLVVSLLAGASSASARQTAVKAVRYHGYVVRVPRFLEGLRPEQGPARVRALHRHALYLGPARAAAELPAHAIGRTEAILVQPATALVPRARPSRRSQVAA